ncbi:MAG: LemA family protein [Candidatus Thiodiazotropha sp. (ex Cardiolucina cf. quadrata)]|nr:LemA family protein [Candidatus Thiodiazotropha sp. (ex Cardiolucina cf. quadrata)]
MTTLIVLLVIILGLIGFGVGLYNKLITGRNRYQNAFVQIDVQLTRRHDLIPNLVETAKGYMKHEKETLEAVIEARNRAVSGLQQAAKDPSDPDAMKQLAEAERGLSGALGRLFALAEAYPDLKANENMMQLSEELVSTENKVAFARQAYNDAVMQYNIDRESFPSNLISGWFRFQSATLLEIEDEAKREVPKVSFN